MNTLDLTDYPPPNQEANNQITDLDLTISLSDGIGTTCTENNDYAYGIKLISETMNERLGMLKTRESLLHGLNTGTYADWFRARPRCFLSLDNSDDAEKFKRYWLKLSESIVKQSAQKGGECKQNQGRYYSANRTRNWRKCNYAQEAWWRKTKNHINSANELEQYRKYLATCQFETPESATETRDSQTYHRGAESWP